MELVEVEKRSACIDRLADKIQENAGLFAKAETRDNVIGLSTTVDIPRAEKNLRFMHQRLNILLQSRIIWRTLRLIIR